MEQSPLTEETARKIIWDYKQCGIYPCSCCRVLPYTKKSGKEVTCRIIYLEATRILKNKQSKKENNDDET